jgi:hypothetical protein
MHDTSDKVVVHLYANLLSEIRTMLERITLQQDQDAIVLT